MKDALTAQDLWAVVVKLPHDEQLRLARLALVAASRSGPDAAAYAAHPPTELTNEDDGLAWDAEGWDDVDAAR